MGLMDKVKQVVKGRSEMVEKGIDRAVGAVDKRTKGKYSDKLAKPAAALKARARQLDDDRGDASPGDRGDGDPSPM